MIDNENPNQGPDNDLKETPATREELPEVEATEAGSTAVEDTEAQAPVKTEGQPEDQAEIDEMMKVVRAKNQNK